MSQTSKNPFMLSFGRIPVEYITREGQKTRIIETFTVPPITDQIFIITGLRGSGKTVLLSTIMQELTKYKDWIIIPLNPSNDMVQSFYSELYYKLKTHHIKIAADFSIPSTGVHIAMQPDQPERTIRSRIEQLLEQADRKKLHILVTVDEVSKNESMRQFAQLFQSMIMRSLPLFFLGTGIYDNIEELQNVKDLTFLYRAPRITLEPLDLLAITNRYQAVFQMDDETAATLAKLTRGYSFAFQALGYTYWNHMPVTHVENVLPDYDQLLAQASYSKIWKELSETDRLVCKAIAAHEGSKVQVIRKEIQMDSSLFGVYRQRLKIKGLLNTDTYGKISFTLPRFSNFINIRAVLYEDV